MPANHRASLSVPPVAQGDRRELAARVRDARRSIQQTLDELASSLQSVLEGQALPKLISGTIEDLSILRLEFSLHLTLIDGWLSHPEFPRLEPKKKGKKKG